MTGAIINLTCGSIEGSVRRAGNKVRVTGQLIHAATDELIVFASAQPEQQSSPSSPGSRSAGGRQEGRGAAGGWDGVKRGFLFPILVRVPLVLIVSPLVEEMVHDHQEFMGHRYGCFLPAQSDFEPAEGPAQVGWRFPRGRSRGARRGATRAVEKAV